VVIGGLVSIGICILWVRFFRTRKRRILVSTILGVILLMIGSYLVGIKMVLTIILPLTTKLTDVAVWEIVIHCFAAPLTFIGSYFLCFQRKGSLPLKGSE